MMVPWVLFVSSIGQICRVHKPAPVRPAPRPPESVRSIQISRSVSPGSCVVTKRRRQVSLPTEGQIFYHAG